MSPRIRILHETAARLRNAGIFHRMADAEPIDGRVVSIDGRKLINFGSCSYLGLETDTRLIEAAYAAMRSYGTQFSTSRAYVSVPPYQRLEELLSRIVGGLPIAMGTTTTLLHAAALPVLVEPGDTVLYDVQVHNSVQSVLPMLAALGAKVESIPHNQIERVEQIAATTPGRVVYLCDAIYSMFGDSVPLDDLFGALERRSNLWAYVDDAHGFGWAGKYGAGVVLGTRPAHERMFVVLGLAKAFAGSGAFIACPTRAAAELVFSCGSTNIFSGPLVPAVLGAAVAAAEILLSSELPRLQAQLGERVACFVEACAAQGLVTSTDATPLKFLRIGEAERAILVCQRLLEDGFFTNVAMYPAVPRDAAGVRVLFNLHHTLDDIRRLVASLAAAVAATKG